MFATVFNDLIVLFCFLIVGFILRELIKPLQKLFIPASVLGGLVALIVGPQVLGLIELPETLSGMTGPMIVLVMTAMFMGMKVSKASLKNYAGATDISCMLYFAQAAVGLLVGCGLSAVWDTLPEHWGVIGVFSFFGGHGTAASAGAIFGEYGIDGSLDLGIIFSTLGLVLAMVVGVVILNIGARKGYVSTVTKNADPSMYGGLIPENKRTPIGMERVSGSGINSFALQLGILLACIWVGDKLFALLGSVVPFVNKFPSFLHGMVGAIIVWLLLQAVHLDGYVDKKTVGTISNVALDICVTAAVATLNLKMVSTYLLPIVIYTVVLVALTIFVCFFFGKRWVGKDWFETVLIIFGQGLGSSTTGMALGRCADPDGKTCAYDSFGVSASVMGPVASFMVALFPMLCMQSDWIVIGISLAVVVACLLIGELTLRKK